MYNLAPDMSIQEFKFAQLLICTWLPSTKLARAIIREMWLVGIYAQSQLNRISAGLYTGFAVVRLFQQATAPTIVYVQSTSSCLYSITRDLSVIPVFKLRYLIINQVFKSSITFCKVPHYQES